MLMTPSQSTMTAAQCIARLNELDILIPCCDLFFSPELHCTVEPSEIGLIITFADGSTARYDDGDYWVT